MKLKEEMERIFNFEQMRIIAVSIISPVMAITTPIKGFIWSLVVMFAFNIFAGMRADGVAIKHCKNFSFKKFKNALIELLLYLLIIEVVYIVMRSCGDESAALIVIKTLTYVFMYVYLQNAFRNLILAYPQKIAFRVVYHIIRFEFTRALPSHIQPIIQRLEEEFGKDEKQKKNKKNEQRDSNNS